MANPILLLDRADLAQLGIKYTRSHLWRLVRAGRFPKPVKLSESRNVWRADEVDTWIQQRIAARDSGPAV